MALTVETKDTLAFLAYLFIQAGVLLVVVGAVVLGLLAGHPEPLLGLVIVVTLFGLVWGLAALIDRR